ncbi:tetratricopeptide repeat protein [Pseudomonas sp. GCM10022188]|uniref:tetratricopeptide repeat protein n=1 Tax=Pseudomonas TaxID=286 RepID=UPI001E4480FD|nr:tetratricopeptide repeat protein [Pseudomonas oryzagri]MCC6075958.1 tetratricopeptide repeat protein [Pseudomonas oryzagri]
MHRIALLAALAATLAGCQTMGEGVVKSRNELYDGGRAVLYEVQKGADSPEQAMRIAATAYAAGDTDQALFQYLRASELDPHRYEALVWVGRIHRERGNHKLAEVALHKVLADDPGNLDALAELGTLQIGMRLYPEAADTLGTALHIDQQRFGGGELTNLGALKVDATSPLRVYNGLGVLADLRNDYSSAQVYYRLALQISPRSAMVANSQAYSFYLAGDWVAARQAYHQALSYDATYKPAWRNYGMLLTRMGSYEEALSAFEQVESRAEASNDVGYICLIEGKLEQAEQFFRTAIDQSPSHYEVAWQNLKRVQQIRRLRENDDSGVNEATPVASDPQPVRAPVSASLVPAPVVSTVSLPTPLQVGVP